MEILKLRRPFELKILAHGHLFFLFSIMMRRSTYTFWSSFLKWRQVLQIVGELYRYAFNEMAKTFCGRFQRIELGLAS